MADGFAANDFRESDRQNLMKHILDAVKQCQVRFGGKTELATERDSCVQCLLVQFEHAFLHGLRKGKVWGAINSLSEPFRQVTGKVLSGLPDNEITYWPFIKEYMVASEIQRLMSLNGISTDSGRCRAWLRSCLNENSLERTLIAVLSDKNILRQHYEDWALFLDEERSSTLPVMARGLGFIVFAIEIEGAQLNTQMKQPTFPRSSAALMPVENRGRHDPLPVIPDRGEIIGGRVAGSKKKRKKKVNQATINDIEEPDDEPTANNFERNRPTQATAHTSSSRSVEDVKSAVEQRQPDHAEMIKKFTQSHRRATSLESSDINQQKKRTRDFDSAVSASLEVPDFSNRRVSSEEVAKEGVVVKKVEDKYNERKPAESEVSDKNFDKINETGGNSDYANLIAKLTNLSTSFKTSFSSGFLHRIGSRENDNEDEKEANVASSGSVENLLEENDVFTSNSKLEITSDANEGTEKGAHSQTSSVKLKNETDVSENISNFQRSSTEAASIPIKNPPKLGSSGREVKSRSRNPSDSFETILGKGDYFSPNNNSIVKMEGVLKLNTPPSTPASNTNQKSPDKGPDLACSGLEQRLHELRRAEDKNAVGLSTVGDSVIDAQFQTIDENEPIDELNSGMKSCRPKSVDDSTDSISINSSNTESVTEDLDVMQPVGFESGKFSEMVMTFDRQSSQAANDALQLLRTSSEMHHGYETCEEQNDGSNTTMPSGRVADFSMASGTCENDLSTADLKQAILATVKRKDEVEERNKVLQLAIDEEREYSLSIKTELDNLRENHETVTERNSKKIDALSRENEVLRNQLKKYVAAVQLLKRENRNISKETNEAIGTLRGFVEDSDVVLPPPPKERTESEMDSIYEEKLVQMAELHGELMEFHESMQRDLLRKQNQIAKMREELIVLRGPLPNDLEASMSNDRNCGQHRPLINIWIPSVFVQGKGSDAHHLYQVYIRIGDEEWNIYRRYSQFHKMHLSCCKEHTDVEKFNFPPKKILAKKDIKFVEGRRRKLQEYIRRLINLWITTNSELAQSPNKHNLENALTFFSDEFKENGKKKKENPKRRNTPVYTGL